MAITVDDATVAAFSSGAVGAAGSVSSASFTPASGALLVCELNVQESPGANPVTVSGGGLTWTQRVARGAGDGDAGSAEIWTAVGAGASMTVTITRTGGDASSRRVRGKVYILSGQSASPIGASNKGAWTVDETTGQITATGPGRLMGVGTDANVNGTPDGVAGQTHSTFTNAGQLSGVSAYLNSDHSSGTISMVFNAELALTPAGNWAILEILADVPVTVPKGSLALMGAGI